MTLVQRFLGRNRWEIAATLVPVGADVVHFLLFERLNDALRGLLRTPGFAPAAALLALYVGWLVSLVFVGKLRPEVRLRELELTVRGDDGRVIKTKTTWPKILFLPVAPFGALFLMMIVGATGLSDGTSVVPENVQMGLVGVGVLAFFGHVIIAAVDVTPVHEATSPTYLAVLVPVVVVGEVVLNLATAAWLHYFGADAAGMAAARARSGGELALAMLLFLLVFAGPRFTFLSRHFTLPSLLSGLAFVTWEVWETLDRIAL